MPELNEIVANNLTTLRKNRHLTQQELAEQIGYSDKSISKWELGKAIPTVDILKEFADFYGVNVDALITEGSSEEKVAQIAQNKNKNNQIIITAMAACFVWFTMTAVYVNALIQQQDLYIMWIVFVWAVPTTFLVIAACARFFWKKCTTFFVCSSLFVWTLFVAVYLQYLVALGQNLWFIFMAAIPIQIMIFLFAKLK
jgi:transcriptional regulator with XRE-family HTH domain